MKILVYLGTTVIAAALATGCVAPASTTTSTTSDQNTSAATTQDVLGSVLGEVIGSSSVGGALGNILASVTGSATTTKKNLIGSWSYNKPAVQFESDNLLVKAGGAAAAAKVEAELEKYYTKVGIKAGKVTFTFNEDGTCAYTIGSKTLQGTWTFDANNKVVTITTATGMSIAAYTTISGNQLSLCFESNKVLSLFSTVASQVSAISSIGQLAGQFDGMKTGFAFVKK